MSPTELPSRLVAAELRHWLAPVVDALLAPYPPLYNPVYVGPLPHGQVLVDVIQRSAVSARGPVVVGGRPPDRGVWVATAAVAECLLLDGVVPRPEVQWVVWDSSAASGLPDRVAGWLGAQGLAVDPGAAAAEWSATTSVAGTVASARARGERDGERVFVVVVGEDGDLHSLGSELRLHFELELGTTVPWGPFVDAGDPDIPRVLVVVSGDNLGQIHRRLARLRRGPPWGLVVDVETAAVLRSEAWSRVMTRSVWIPRRRATRLEEAGFPPIRELLTGVGVTPGASEIIQFSTSSISLPEILQAAEGWARSGTLVVFRTDGAGWISVGDGRVRGAGIANGGDVVLPDEAALYDVLEILASWSDAGVVLVPDDSPDRGGVPIGRAVMALAHGRDRPLEPPRNAPALLRPYQVADLLIARGMAEVARVFLQARESNPQWGAEEEVRIGWLMADRDPAAAVARLRQGAVRALRELDAAGPDLYLDSLLDAVTLSVREGFLAPDVAWMNVRRWVETEPAWWTSTVRRLVMWFELALRAGEAEMALSAQLHLVAAVDSTFAWSSLLHIAIPTGGYAAA